MCFGGCGMDITFELAEVLHLRPQAELTEENGFCPLTSALEPLSAVLGCSNCNQWCRRESDGSGNQWTWQRYEFDWGAAGKTWEAPTFPDGTEWDPEDQDSPHYLNGFVGTGRQCEYLDPGTQKWGKKHLASLLRKQRRAAEL